MLKLMAIIIHIFIHFLQILVECVRIKFSFSFLYFHRIDIRIWYGNCIQKSTIYSFIHYFLSFSNSLQIHILWLCATWCQSEYKYVLTLITCLNPKTVSTSRTCSKILKCNWAQKIKFCNISQNYSMSR